MAKYRLASLAELARHMGFAPQDVRALQIARAEELLHIIDPARAYPLDFVIHRITDYRPAEVPPELLAGLALQHDLGLLIEQVSATLNLHADRLHEPVLTIEDLCVRLGVTVKTIQRWRRRGLPARSVIFPGGKRRVGFLLSSVERFLTARGAGVLPGAVRPAPDAAETAAMVRNARRLAVECGCCVELMCRRLARKFGRSAMAVLHVLRKHDEQRPDEAVLPLAAAPVDAETAAAITSAYRGGASVRDLARRYARPRSAIYHVILDGFIRRLARRRVKFHDDPLFHHDDAAQMVEALGTCGALSEPCGRDDDRMPRDMPACMRELYRTPLLTGAAERALFTKLNYHKFLFVQARRRLDPELARWREVRALQKHLGAAAAIRQQIVRANLRLAASIARRHASGEAEFMELLGEGVIALTRAADGFDISRGNRFSTYATWALMKAYARAASRMRVRQARSEGGEERLAEMADARAAAAGRNALDRDQVAALLSRLPVRERSVLAGHFGLEGFATPVNYDELGRMLGISAGSVRRIEARAILRLRQMAAAARND